MKTGFWHGLQAAWLEFHPNDRAVIVAAGLAALALGVLL